MHEEEKKLVSKIVMLIRKIYRISQSDLAENAGISRFWVNTFEKRPEIASTKTTLLILRAIEKLEKNSVKTRKALFAELNRLKKKIKVKIKD